MYFFSSATRRRLFDGFRAELSGPGRGQSGDREIRLDLIAKARPVSPVDARQKSQPLSLTPDPRPHCSGRLSLRVVNW